MASNFKLKCLVLRLHLSTQFEHSALIRQITHSHIVVFLYNSHTHTVMDASGGGVSYSMIL